MCSVTAIETLTKIEQGPGVGGRYLLKESPTWCLVGVKALGRLSTQPQTARAPAFGIGASQFSCSLAVTLMVTTMNLPN